MQVHAASIERSRPRGLPPAAEGAFPAPPSPEPLAPDAADAAPPSPDEGVEIGPLADSTPSDSASSDSASSDSAPSDSAPSDSAPSDSAPSPSPAPAAVPWTAAFLAAGPAALRGPERGADLRREALRFATGAGFAALYGLALGARAGGADLLRHAAGVPAAFLAVTALGVPALFIVLALFNAPLLPARVVAAAARASASAGLALAGLAPAAALFVVTSDRPGAAALAAAAGLVLGGLAGLARLLRELSGGLSRASHGGAASGPADERVRAAAAVAFSGFALFATALAARIWWSTLPILGGAL